MTPNSAPYMPPPWRPKAQSLRATRIPARRTSATLPAFTRVRLSQRRYVGPWDSAARQRYSPTSDEGIS